MLLPSLPERIDGYGRFTMALTLLPKADSWWDSEVLMVTWMKKQGAVARVAREDELLTGGM